MARLSGARRSTTLAALSDEEAVQTYDRHLERAEACLDLILGEESTRSVRYKKYAIELFDHLRQVRDALQRLAPGERDSLAAAFGSSEEGCDRVARLLIVLTGGAEDDSQPDGGVLQLQRQGDSQELLGTPDRLEISQGALRAYRSVAGVLDTLSLRKAIEKARSRRREHQHFTLGLAQKLRARASTARRSLAQRAEEAAAIAAAAAAVAAEPEVAAGTSESEEEEGDRATPVANLLLRVDESSVEESSGPLQQILQRFDLDGDGVLSGSECDALVAEVADYVSEEYARKFSRFNMKMEKTMIAEWVRGTIDLNGDGQITRDEILRIKKVVDDID